MLRTALIVAVAYALIGWLMLSLEQYVGLAAPLWPSAGIAFAVVYQRGRPVALGVAAGSLVLNAAMMLGDGHSVGFSIVIGGIIGIGAAAQALVGAMLVQRYVGYDSHLATPRDTMLFLTLAGPVAAIANATIGVAANVLGAQIAISEIWFGWLTWWSGDAIGVMIFAPITLMLFRDHDEAWRGRRLAVAVPSLLVAIALTGLFVQARALEQVRTTETVKSIADNAVDALANSLGRHGEAIESIGSLYLASENVAPEEFGAFTRSALARFPTLQALSWNPYLRPEQLQAFIDAQREHEPFADFTVTERDGDGERVEVARRDHYVPVAVIEPMATNAAALGFDIASDPVRAAAIDRARDTGEISGTAPITLVQETGEQKGMLVLAPIYMDGMDPGGVDERQDSIIGFGVGVYRLGDLIEETFAGPTWSDVDVTVSDVSDEPVEIGHFRGTSADPDPDLATTIRLDAHGRTWAVRVTPTAASIAGDDTALLAMMLLGGVVVTGLFQSLLLVVTGSAKLARREADSARLQAMRDPLTGVLNRRGFHEAASALEGSTSEHVLLYIDLDGFKQVNDIGGHHVGDDMLSAVALAISSAVRSHDVVARLGGDEFATILNECSIDVGVRVAASIVNAVAGAAIRGEGETFTVTASIGAAAFAPGDDLDERMLAADRACYDAKRTGRGTVVVAPAFDHSNISD